MKYLPARLAGMRGYDGGRVVHALIDPVSSDRALCGKSPKPGSMGWALLDPVEVMIDCFRCEERIAIKRRREEKKCG